MNNSDIIAMSENYSEAIQLLRKIYFNDFNSATYFEIEDFLIDIGEIEEL